jgi:RNA polymerase sigma-70 factor (ECF subfamily)
MSTSSNQPSDEDLARRARGQDMTAFEELVRRYEKRIYGFLLRRTSDRRLAEDLAQDTFVRAFRKIARYNPRHAFKTWLFTIANRLAASHYRAEARRIQPVPLEHALGCPAEPDEDREAGAAIWETARSHLPPDQTTALLLKYADAMSVNEIAAIMNKSPGNVKVLLHRARKRLAKALRDPRVLDERPTETESCVANATN